MTRGDIYLVDLDPVVGRELGGTRPVVVLTNDALNALPWVVTVLIGVDAAVTPPGAGVVVPAADSGLPMDIRFPSLQVRALDPGRFPDRPAGSVPGHLLQKLGNAIQVMMDL